MKLWERLVQHGALCCVADRWHSDRCGVGLAVTVPTLLPAVSPEVAWVETVDADAASGEVAILARLLSSLGWWRLVVPVVAIVLIFQGWRLGSLDSLAVGLIGVAIAFAMLRLYLRRR